MRVIAGSAKGIPLCSVKSDKTRPILDRVKGSLFNILSDVIPNSRVIDLYAGTGAIGIEALSRGAVFCIFVEKEKAAIQVIRKNLEVTKLQDKALVLQYDVFEVAQYLEKNKREVDLVLASPPYPFIEKSPYMDKLLIMFSSLCNKHILQPDGLIILQHRTMGFKIPSEASCLELFDTRVYGDTQLSFFKVHYY